MLYPGSLGAGCTEIMYGSNAPCIYVKLAIDICSGKSWSIDWYAERISDIKTENSDIKATYVPIYVTSSNQYYYSGKLISNSHFGELHGTYCSVKLAVLQHNKIKLTVFSRVK